MLDLAVNAGLPLIVVKTDDLLYAPDVIKALTGKTAVLMKPSLSAKAFSSAKYVLWTEDPSLVNPQTHDDMEGMGHSLIALNCPPAGVAFDAGVLMPPDTLLKTLAKEVIPGQSPQSIAQIATALRGLTAKQAVEVLSLSLAQFNASLTAAMVRKMRGGLNLTSGGLSLVSTDLGFYEPLPELEKWAKDQSPYFLDAKFPGYLRPRGILFAGPPGTGKTMAARYLAKTLGVSLYRLDLATTLSRYIGESEARLASSLAVLDREEPCVVLLDEVEKVFSIADSDNAVVRRMLSQLLWWMQDHSSRVLTVMTTNNKADLPPELYREGRVDMVVEVPLLSVGQATTLAHQVWKSMANGKVDLKQLQVLTNLIKQVSQMQASPPSYSHAWVHKMVVDTAKANKWITL